MFDFDCRLTDLGRALGIGRAEPDTEGGGAPPEVGAAESFAGLESDDRSGGGVKPEGLVWLFSSAIFGSKGMGAS